MIITTKHKKKCLDRLGGKADKKQLANINTDNTALLKKDTGNNNTVVNGQLSVDLGRLSKLDSIEDKIALKKGELVPKYLPLVNEYIESGEIYQNPMFVRVIIWLFDIGDVDQFIKLAKRAIAQGQSAPDGFKTDLPTFVVSQFAEWANEERKAKRSSSPYIEAVADAVACEEWEVNQPIVKCLLFKCMGQYADAAERYQDAVTWYERAKEANPKGHGVKIILEKAQKKI